MYFHNFQVRYFLEILTLSTSRFEILEASLFLHPFPLPHHSRATPLPSFSLTSYPLSFHFQFLLSDFLSHYTAHPFSLPYLDPFALPPPIPHQTFHSRYLPTLPSLSSRPTFLLTYPFLFPSHSRFIPKTNFLPQNP
jgi:hypothetical protein